MKSIDKETLIKHRFWIMLGGVGLMAFIMLIWLLTWVSSDVEVRRQKIQDHQKKLTENAAARLKGEEEKKVLDNKIKKLTERKGIVWNEAWELQNPAGDPLIVWPKPVEKEFTALNFGESPADTFIPNVATYVRAENYAKQYQELADIFKATLPGTKITLDPVQFAGKRGWKDVLWHVEAWKTNVDAEEVWLAQEDYWVQRDLLRGLKRALHSVAHFTPPRDPDPNATLDERKEAATADKPDASKDEIARRRFINGGGRWTNATWQLDLALVRKDGNFRLTGRIKNVGKRRQPLGKIYFWVRVHKDETARPALLEIQGEALGIRQNWPFTSPALKDLFRNPEGIFDVEQIFDASTSPIRRVDEIALFRHSHRTFQPKLERPAFCPPPAAPASSSAPLVGDDAPKAKDDLERTDNGLVRTRYYDKTDQVRRLPLGLVLIVDQAYLPEVETALANCKLRFQTTQCSAQHFRGNLTAAKEEKTLTPPAASAASTATDNNLVELAIYGIASLYERPTKKGETDVKETASRKKEGTAPARKGP